MRFDIFYTAFIMAVVAIIVLFWYTLSLNAENGTLSAKVYAANTSAAVWQEEALSANSALAELLERRSRPERVIKATVTAYTPRVEETNSDPFTTAFMTPVREGTVAVSRDLLEDGWAPGMKVYIKGFGVFVINDIMNERFTKRLDIFVHDLDKAIEIGINHDMLAALFWH